MERLLENHNFFFSLHEMSNISLILTDLLVLSKLNEII